MGPSIKNAYLAKMRLREDEECSPRRDALEKINSHSVKFDSSVALL